MAATTTRVITATAIITTATTKALVASDKKLLQLTVFWKYRILHRNHGREEAMLFASLIQLSY